MTVSQAQRFALYDKMKETIGERNAATLMEILPTMDTNDIATKRDVENATILLRSEMADLRTELKTEMADLRTELKTEMADLRGVMVAQFGELRGELKASTRHSIITIIAAAVTIWLTFYVPNVL